MDSISHMANPSIDPIIQVIEEAAIRKVENYYCMCIDFRDFASLSKVVAEDADLDYGPGIGTVHGVQALSGILEKMTSPVLAQHTVTTQVISLSSPAQAAAITYVVANQFGKGEKEGIPLYAYVRYDDRLAKGADGWKITKRSLTYMGPHTGDISIFGI